MSARLPGRILLATDGSEDAQTASRAASDLAQRSGARLHVVHAFEFIPPRGYRSVALRLRPLSDHAARARSLLEEQVERIEGSGVPVEGAHLKTGPAVDGILSAAEETGAGMVVVGSRGLGGVGRLLMGSVSEGVVHHARCPVLVARGEEADWPPAHVMMADDSSEEAEGAAELGASFGGLLGADGSLIQVYPRLLKSPAGARSPESAMVERALRRAREELEDRARGLGGLLGTKPEARTVVDEGSEGMDGIAMTIIDAATATGVPTLLCVGSRGLGGTRRARVGGVAAKVVRAAEGPVLVCPRTAAGRAGPDDGAVAGRAIPL